MKLKMIAKLSSALNRDKKIKPIYDGLVNIAKGFCASTGADGDILPNIKSIYCENNNPFKIAIGPRI